MTSRRPLLVLLALAALLAPLPVALAIGCPNQCYRQGACTRGICNCYRGFAGPDCVFELEHEVPGRPAYTELVGGQEAPHKMRIAVASAQVLGSSFHDDLDVVIPGLTVARQLAAQKHEVTLIFNMGEQRDMELRKVWQEALLEEGIQLQIIYYTQHYYLPANLAQSFETYAWLSDWVSAGNPSFDIVFFHDGHGLPYFSALAKHQDIPVSGLRDTLLIMSSQLPLLWLTTKGGGPGLKNVDELEINFIEHESARLVDHVITSSPYFDQWMKDRNWRMPWTTFNLPQPLPLDDVRRIEAAKASASGAAPLAEGAARQFVFIIEGPGSGVLGKSVSSGKNANSQVSRTVSKEDDADLDRFKYVTADVLTACETATKLSGMLGEEALNSTAFTFFLLGADPKTEPHAARQIKHLAKKGRWAFEWAVARGPAEKAVEHAAAPGRTVLMQASRFRGSATMVLVRRVVAAQAAARAAGSTTVLTAAGDAAEVLETFVTSSDPAASPFVSPTDTDAIMHAMLDAFHGRRAALQSAQDEVELATASATWLNHLQWHTHHIRREVFTYDGTATELFQGIEDAEDPAPRTISKMVAGVVITTSAEAVRARPPAAELKGDPIRAEAKAETRRNNETGWRREVASRQATRVARWSAQQLGYALESHNDEAFSRRLKGLHQYTPLFPPYERPLVTVVITHYNRPKLLPLAVRSVAEQTYPNIQLVVVDDGSPNADVPAVLDQVEQQYDFAKRGWSLLREKNRYLGAARNRGVRESRGEYILFMDDDNVAKPFEVEYFVQAAESTGADILTSFVDFVWGENYPALPPVKVPMCSQIELPQGLDKNFKRSPSFVFLGGSADVGIFKNCFGDANSFFRKSTFLKIGGYSEDRGIGYEDWEIYSRAALKGYNLMVVAHSLYWYRFTGGSMQKTTSYSRSRQRALRAYLEALAEQQEKALAGQEALQRDSHCGAGEQQCRNPYAD